MPDALTLKEWAEGHSADAWQRVVEWMGLLTSLVNGVLTPIEQQGFNRALLMRVRTLR